MAKKKKPTSRNDVLNGKPGDDVINALAGNDTVDGKAGNDTLTGGAGRDTLAGGTGNDIFRYVLASESAAAGGAFNAKAGDTITDFSSGQDRLDLTALGTGLAFNGTVAGKNMVWHAVSALPSLTGSVKVTDVFADTNGDGVADLAVRLTGEKTLTAADFVNLAAAKPVLTVPATASFAENGAVATPVLEAKADGTVTWSLEGDDAALFAISADGKVTFKASPDFEKPADKGANNVYDLVIKATNAVGGVASQAVSVTVGDLSDTPPKITSGLTTSVAENTAITSAIYDAEADQPNVTWSFAGGADDNRFTIEAATGIIRFKAQPNYEIPVDAGTNNVYDVMVKVTNQAGQSETKALAIGVTNVFEVSPVITSAASADAADQVAATFPVYVATANEAVTWSISGGADADKFNIDATTGVVRFKQSPVHADPKDNGKDNVYDITVKATDGEGNAGFKAIKITVKPADTANPVITSAADAEVTENIDTNATAYLAKADEAVTWSIVGGADAGKFNIDANTGVVTFKQSPDFEAPSDTGGNNTYTFDLMATDQVSKPSVVKTVTITVKNAAEFASASVAYCDENTPAANAIYQAKYDNNNTPVTWNTVLGGPDGAKFSIDAMGNVRFLASPDFEMPSDADKDNVYVITLQGTLAGGGTVTESVEIRVLPKLEAGDGIVMTGLFGGNQVGMSVSSAGDVNGDGIEDLIVGAPQASNGNNVLSGMAYVVYGRPDWASLGVVNGTGPNNLALNTLAASEGFAIQGTTAGDQVGTSVSAAGDVNGDGLDDVIVGARYATGGGAKSGMAYVVFGSTAGGTVSLDNLPAVRGVIIKGDDANDFAGRSVSSAGDINGDGIDDILVGAPQSESTGSNDGEAYVIFGSNTGFGLGGADPAVIDLANLTAQQGFVIRGDNDSDRLGANVSAAGDINGDGLADLVVGAPIAGLQVPVGECYVVFGKTSDFGTAEGSRRVLDVTNLSASDGFVIRGVPDLRNAGYDVSNAGDVNGDGFDDLIINAVSNTGGNRFVSLVFGSDSDFGTNETVGGVTRRVLDLANLTATQGVFFTGPKGTDTGYSVASAGDVNGDGFMDLVIGAIGADDGAVDGGAVYVVFGKGDAIGSINAATGQRELNLAELAGDDGFQLRGATAGDKIGWSVSSAGDLDRDGFDDLVYGAPFGIKPGTTNATGYAATLFGSAFGKAATPFNLTATANADRLIGGWGNDTIVGIAANDSARGGAGNDVLSVTGTAFRDIDGGNGIDRLTILGAGDVFDFAVLGTRVDSIEVIDMLAAGSQTVMLTKETVLQLSDNVANGITTLTIFGDSADGVTFDNQWTFSGVVGAFESWTNGNARILVDADIMIL